MRIGDEGRCCLRDIRCLAKCFDHDERLVDRSRDRANEKKKESISSKNRVMQDARGNYCRDVKEDRIRIADIYKSRRNTDWRRLGVWISLWDVGWHRLRPYPLERHFPAKHTEETIKSGFATRESPSLLHQWRHAKRGTVHRCDIALLLYRDF